jgi:hypothetical protein
VGVGVGLTVTKTVVVLITEVGLGGVGLADVVGRRVGVGVGRPVGRRLLVGWAPPGLAQRPDRQMRSPSQSFSVSHGSPAELQTCQLRYSQSITKGEGRPYQGSGLPIHMRCFRLRFRLRRLRPKASHRHCPSRTV